jgi:hypothetical protein
MGTRPPSNTAQYIVAYELRRDCLQQLGFMRQYSIILAASTLCTLAAMVGSFLANDVYNFSFTTLSFGWWLATAFAVAAEVYYLAITVTSINSQMTTGYWDLLKLTNIDESAILQAKIAVAQYRGRRVLRAVRLVSLVAYVISIMPWVLPHLLGRTASINNIPYPQYLPGYLPIILWTGLVQACWIPSWNMQLVIVIGLAISGHVRNAISAVFIGLGTLAILRVVMFYMLAVLSSIIAEAVFYHFGWVEFFVRNILAVILQGAAVYVLYELLKVGSLRLARYYAFRPD